MSQELIDAITDMREEDALAITEQILGAGGDPFKILDDCRKAMEIVGGRFEREEAFIPELMLAGEMLAQITELVKPYIQQEATSEKRAKVVFGTVEGDIHDIAKDIVVFMLDINLSLIHI